ncbi:MAG: DUF1858 domain-containing protein [Actinomycetia bacterium]|nr:DUF1858 domain-containing protein [Actinomycetes bacterium]MCP5034987.1 DUF1858 domain-containing protein [Actinomycetes bacterium]
MPERSDITDATKVATLLTDYPELEELLISMSPAFVKLRNPVLRRSVARVATLKQAASVGGIEVGDFVNELRVAAGLAALVDMAVEETEYFGPQPDWFSPESIVVVMREEDLDPDVMPINPLLRTVRDLSGDEIAELVTSHLPAPGIDILKRKGYRTWVEDRDGSIHTFVNRPTTI